MKKNIIISFLFIIAATVFLVVIIYTASSGNINKAGETNLNTNGKTVTVECYKDADCLVAGCSGQLCVPRDKAPSVISTCEWKDEYACYAEDSCLCRNNKCQWAGSEQFVECIQNLQ